MGAGGYGPVHSPDHRIRHSPRNCRWAVTVRDVPASDSRAIVAEVSQHGQRSVVSVPPMAGQSSSVGGGRNQDRTLRAAIAPFVERLVGTLRRECLDRTLFWTTADLEAKLREFQEYFNEHRTHAGLAGRLPDSNGPASPIRLASYGWQKHCRGLYQTPIAA